MAYDAAFGEWVREHFAGLGPMRIRPMFGAAAVYVDDLIWALLDDGVVWLKVDEENEAALRAAGARPFTYALKAGGVATLPYWSLPEAAADDPDEAMAWARASIAAAARKAAKKRKPKTLKA